MYLRIPFKFSILLLVFFLIKVSPAKSYSVLTHEALIDASWENHIKPLLQLKYPLATKEDLKTAHAYAYGGCLIADMGYFPFGSDYFTNLAHYVRSGDFVENLLSEAQNLDEYAFALGSLCHYMGDKYGHSLGTNHIVPLVYPKMEKKFGNVVTYGDNHLSHSRVEISFDVLETARGNYAPQAYHDFIGFEVARPVLERAFSKTYGEDINNVFGDFDLAIGSYRWAVKSLMPTVTRSAWVLRKDDIKKLNPSANNKSFHYKMHKRDYYKEFGFKRQKPSFGDKILSIIITILPKVGPLKVLKFKDIGPNGERIFIQSFDTVLVHYHDALAKLKDGKIELPDVDYDTGKPTEPGEYKLADQTYDDLLDRLEDNNFNSLTEPLKQNILNFYSKADTIAFAKADKKYWKKTSLALQQIKMANTVKQDSLKDARGNYYKLNEPALPNGK